MKIVVSAKGQDLKSEVDPRFGRAAGFILFDTETHDFMAVDNSQTLNAPSGAGMPFRRLPKSSNLFRFSAVRLEARRLKPHFSKCRIRSAASLPVRFLLLRFPYRDCSMSR